MSGNIVRKRLFVKGIVQGVGFRPFIYRLAKRYGLAGWVLNDPAGVTIEIEGTKEAAESFEEALHSDKPPLAVINSVEAESTDAIGDTSFVIRESCRGAESTAFISPDVATCPDCLRELLDPQDRRYRYPFINCTNCGPRYTIIRDLPYDRPFTTMAKFEMCPECQSEYDDPTDRRFHAQPNACWKCGPSLVLLDENCSKVECSDPMEETILQLKAGKIVAIKGIGGFHLAVDATNDAAVHRLREKKHREEKPFAIMFPDAETTRESCRIDKSEQLILESPERPIVLLPKRQGNPISPAVAPRSKFFGIILPYTPIHHIVMREQFTALVMTSGNITDEPIVSNDLEVRERLVGVADYILTHDRDIHIRCDDSIVRVLRGKEVITRRARGFVPRHLPIEKANENILAVGAELKSSICLTKGESAFFSQHIGDLKDAKTLSVFEEIIRHLCDVLEIEPTVIAHDLHPDYLSTQYARSRESDIELVGVQHHHAHIAGCMAEHRLKGPVIGLSFDGTGYGPDGTVWGGEFLMANYRDYQRVGHLRTVPMPGGDAAIKEPDRMALAYLIETFGHDLTGVPQQFLDIFDPDRLSVLQSMIEKKINCPLTSSMGRLFDAVSALTGICTRATFEGQPAMELEGVAGTSPGGYEFELDANNVADWRGIIRGVARDVAAGIFPDVISAKFHNTIAELIVAVCERLREETSIDTVALSGGVFQNARLLRRAGALLKADGFHVYFSQRVPTNDGGLALGQAMVALHRNDSD